MNSDTNNKLKSKHDEWIGDEHDIESMLNDEIARLREENAASKAEIERYKRGVQGLCYACEPVAEMNHKLEAEVARLREEIEKLQDIANRACNLLNLKGGYHESYELRNEIQKLKEAK